MAGTKESAQLLVRKLSSGCAEEENHAVSEIRVLSKWDPGHRVSLVQAGALSPLVELLPSLDPAIQENAITALLNLSIHNDNREAIVHVPGGLEAIMQVIRNGLTIDAKANAAALLYSLVVEESVRPVLGSNIPLLGALLELLRTGSSKCKGDCLKALFYIAMNSSNKANLVAGGAVPLLLTLSRSGKGKLIECSLAVLAQIAGCPEGATALLSSDTAIPDVISLLNNGTPIAQENAASTLFNLCLHRKEEAIREILDDITCIPALRKLYASASVRGKSKAEALMKVLHVRLPLSLSSEDSSDTISVNSSDGIERPEELNVEPISLTLGFGKTGLRRKLRRFTRGLGLPAAARLVLTDRNLQQPTDCWSLKGRKHSERIQTLIALLEQMGKRSLHGIDKLKQGENST